SYIRPPPSSTLFPYTTLFRSDRARLLGDLLEHEVLVAALLGGRGVPGDVVVPAGRRLAEEVGDRHRVGRDQYHLVLAELDGLARSEEHTSELQSLRHLVCRLL